METELSSDDAFTNGQQQTQDNERGTDVETSTRLLTGALQDGAEIGEAEVEIRIVPRGDMSSSETPGHLEDIACPEPSSRLIYRISESPPIYLLIFYALQQGMLAIGSPLTATVIISEATCARTDDYIKTQVLSASFCVVGLATFLVTFLGVRLPIYQNVDFAYLLPLITMSATAEWTCPDTYEAVSPKDNTTILMARIDNVTTIPARELTTAKLSKLNGSLMLVGGIHFLVGCTGLVGVLTRFIGPITIVPALMLIGMLVNKLIVQMSEANWVVAILTCVVNFTLSLCLASKKTPVPMWSGRQGFYILWYPLHQSFSVLLSIIFGWMLSAILTAAGAITDDPKSPQYLARTDARSYIIDQTDWFTVPYPGKLSSFAVSSSAVITCLAATFVSVLDSIGDYGTCARACRVPPPPRSAYNRSIAVEGLMNIFGGAMGCCHPTSSAGASIAVLRMTKVVSRRVLLCCGIIYIVFGLFGKFGAALITLPYPVLGGITFLVMGNFLGFIMSSLQTIDLNSTRNLAIIGTSIMLGLMLPHWVTTRPGVLDTGNADVNNFLLAMLSNPAVVGGVYACFMDNIIPGSLKERGLLHHIKELAGEDAIRLVQSYEDGPEVYQLPFVPQSFYKSIFAKYVPVFEYTGQ